jgi:hypothetical protein
MQQGTLPAAEVTRRGLAAGFAGAVLIDVYLIATLVFAFHAVTLGAFYRYVASAALGKAAYTLPGADVLGIAMHFAVSLGWGVGYAYVAARTPQVRSHPVTSGIVFGIVVMIAMQLVEVAANIYTLPDSLSLLNSFIAHVVFFGLPVAYVVKRFETS